MEGIEQQQRNEFLWQPHPGQIIAIFRILGIGYKDGFFKTLLGSNGSKLVNNLIQIGTGEGKSVTLAVTSCILALYNIDVYCACYSEYLSQRDYSSFSKLFEQLGLRERIHYGTFNKLCESVINDKFDIRQEVTNIVTQLGASKQQIKNINRTKILIIDEVDVFFSEEFYGNIYAPLAKIKHNKIKELTDFLWSNREKKFNMKYIEQTQQFKELCQQFKGWEQLIKEIVKSMKQDLQCFKHDYIVQNQKIGYKEQDQIVFNVVYGYKTMWAHYDEFYKHNITQIALDDNISIQIKCGAFSFAEIPKIFQNILGVTGTLQTMSKAQKKIISDDYDIKILTYMPSIFGKNQCEFNEKASVKYYNKDDYFKEIKDEIKNNIGVKPDQRACLVFFETKEKLMEFYEFYSLCESNINYITNLATPEELSNFIKQSTNPGSVSLLTKLFGRGIDFLVRDQKMNSNRGLHVLQTFLSEELSEETQIKGRTARQGQKETYSMVLLDRDLEKFVVGPKYLEDLKDMQDNNNLYSRLNEKRNLYLDNKQKSISDMIQAIKKEHDDAENFKQSLLEKKKK